MFFFLISTSKAYKWYFYEKLSDSVQFFISFFPGSPVPLRPTIIIHEWIEIDE